MVMVPDCSVLVQVGSDRSSYMPTYVCMIADLSISRKLNTALEVPNATSTEQPAYLSAKHSINGKHQWW